MNYVNDESRTRRNKTMRNYSIRFRIGAVALLAFTAVLTTLDGVSAGPHVQDMRGVFNGFIQEGDNPVELIRTEITEQHNRRFSGIVDASGPHVIEGVVSASGNVIYQGRSASTHIIGRTELHEFEGGAAILNGTQKIQTNDDRFIIPCVLELRSFAGDGSVVPNPVGSYLGTLSGGGEINIRLSDPMRPTSFGGTMEITLDDEIHVFQLLGTNSADGRVVIIGHQATAGHSILTAVLASPPDPVQPTALDGQITIVLGDGSVREGTFQTTLRGGIIVVDG